MPSLSANFQRMKRYAFALAIGALALLAPVAAPAKTRVATFDRSAIVVAYYRSALWADVLKKKQAELDAAKQAGDTAKVAELNAWGPEAQERSGKQLMGAAPIDNILEALQPAFRDIEKSQNVSEVVSGANVPADADVIDVTGKLLDWLKADQKTRDIIRQLQ